MLRECSRKDETSREIILLLGNIFCENHRFGQTLTENSRPKWKTEKQSLNNVPVPKIFTARLIARGTACDVNCLYN